MAAWQEIRCCPNTRLPQISSHFPLRVRQPFSRGGKICGNQSNSTQRTPTTDPRWEHTINPTKERGEVDFSPSAFKALPCGNCLGRSCSLDLLCPPFRQNIKINQGRNDYEEEWLLQTPVSGEEKTCAGQFAKVNKLAAKQPENLDVIAQK